MEVGPGCPVRVARWQRRQAGGADARVALRVATRHTATLRAQSA